MDYKRKYREARDKIYYTITTYPVESVIVGIAAMTAAAKLNNSITQSRNAATWRREVKRREGLKEQKPYDPRKNYSRYNEKRS